MPPDKHAIWPKSVEGGVGLNRTAELTDVYAVVVPVCPGHVLVDISVDARHGRGADGCLCAESRSCRGEKADGRSNAVWAEKARQGEGEGERLGAASRVLCALVGWRGRVLVGWCGDPLLFL